MHARGGKERGRETCVKTKVKYTASCSLCDLKNVPQLSRMEINRYKQECMYTVYSKSIYKPRSNFRHETWATWKLVLPKRTFSFLSLLFLLFLEGP